jgi:hypothetical protein
MKKYVGMDLFGLHFMSQLDKVYASTDSDTSNIELFVSFFLLSMAEIKFKHARLVYLTLEGLEKLYCSTIC